MQIHSILPAWIRGRQKTTPPTAPASPAPLVIDLSGALLTDLSRLWRAEKDGVPRPAPLGNREEVRTLLALYEQEGAKAAGEPLAAFYEQRAAEIRTYLAGRAA